MKKVENVPELGITFRSFPSESLKDLTSLVKFKTSSGSIAPLSMLPSELTLASEIERLVLAAEGAGLGFGKLVMCLNKLGKFLDWLDSIINPLLMATIYELKERRIMHLRLEIKVTLIFQRYTCFQEGAWIVKSKATPSLDCFSTCTNI